MTKLDIFCLESVWSREVGFPIQSVAPILSLLSMAYDIKITHLMCNTKDEFYYNLRFLKKNFGILYLAFHGDSGRILFHSGEYMDLEELSTALRGKFNGIVHFASCSVMNIETDELDKFLKSSGVRFVSGYSKEVYWIPSAATDMVFMDYLIDKRNPEEAAELMKEQLNPSEKYIGFTYYSRYKK